jgi:hypothetical protein
MALVRRRNACFGCLVRGVQDHLPSQVKYCHVVTALELDIHLINASCNVPQLMTDIFHLFMKCHIRDIILLVESVNFASQLGLAPLGLTNTRTAFSLTTSCRTIAGFF